MFLYCQFKLALPCQFFAKKILIRQTKKGDREHCHKYTGAQTEKVQTCSLHETYKKTTKKSATTFLLYETIFKNQAKHQTEKRDRLKRGQVTSDRGQVTEDK